MVNEKHRLEGRDKNEKGTEVPLNISLHGGAKLASH
jgi:hypothetical protein